jgi:hypothetical protein
MVYVRLAQDWIDGTGAARAAGDMVDVDAGTLAELEAAGVVTGPVEPPAAEPPAAEPPAIQPPATAEPPAPPEDPRRAWAGPG